MSGTHRISVAVLALAAATSLSGQAFAHQAFAQAQTGTGGGPTSTITAPNTSSVGQTMPPARGAGAATPDDRRDLTPNEKKDDQLMRGICIGCSKP